MALSRYLLSANSLSSPRQDMSGKVDNFKFAYRRTSGDVTMVVRVNSMDKIGNQQSTVTDLSMLKSI